MKFISFRNETHFGIMKKVYYGRNIRFLRSGATGANHFFFFSLGDKSLFLNADRGGRRRSKMGKDTCHSF